MFQHLGQQFRVVAHCLQLREPLREALHAVVVLFHHRLDHSIGGGEVRLVSRAKQASQLFRLLVVVSENPGRSGFWSSSRSRIDDFLGGEGNKLAWRIKGNFSDCTWLRTPKELVCKDQCGINCLVRAFWIPERCIRGRGFVEMLNTFCPNSYDHLKPNFI